MLRLNGRAVSLKLLCAAALALPLWAHAAETLEALNPYGEVDAPKLRAPQARLATLEGKTIGLLMNMKRSARPMAALVRQRLADKFPGARFAEFYYDENANIAHSFQRPRYEQWLRGVDAVVGMVGDCGSCTQFLVYNTMFAEDRGKPSTALVNTGFFEDARVNAGYRSMPTLRIVSESVPPESSVQAHIQRGIDEAMPLVIASLTSPLTAAELAPQLRLEAVPAIAARGTWEQINRVFYEQGYTYSLPIAVPTRQAVAEMLRDTDIPAQTVVSKMILRDGKATVEKIAINAVMAGALPRTCRC